MSIISSRAVSPRRLVLLPLLALGIGANAQSPLPPAPVTPGRLSQVHVDRPGDGNVWVLAPGYKARFGPDAVEFFPYFGAKAVGSHPVSFALRSVERGGRALPFRADAPPEVEGMRVSYARGALREIWELREGEVEQTFVVDDRAGSGDLVVRLAATTDLRAEDDDTGLRFTHATLGHVHYGDVVAIDAQGRRATSASVLCAGGIELRVPAAFVAASPGPVTIDPVVRAFTVDGGTDQTGNSDVAFEPTTGNWLVVYAREFSTTDSDIVSRRFDSAGAFLEEVVVATGSRESRNPSVGANGPARQFLIAWDEDIGIANRVILGRTRDAGNTSQGSTFTVLDTAGLGRDDIAPSIGGSIATDANGANYAVMCLSDNGSGRHVSFVRVSTGGNVQVRDVLSVTGHDVVEVRTSKARTTNGPWLCIYARNVGGVQHVHVAEAPLTGSTIRRASIETLPDCRLGGIAGRNPEWFVVYSRSETAGNGDIFGRVVRLQTSMTVGAAINLTSREPGAILARDQIRPRVAFDGCRYTYAYQEAAGAAGSFDVYAAVVSVPDIRFSDGHRALPAETSANEQDIAIAGTGEMGGPAARSFVTFDQISGGNLDVAGVLFDGLSPTGGITTLLTSCGRHALTSLDEPALGGTIRFRASAPSPASQVFLIGVPASPVFLCTRCALGVGPILMTVLGASLDLPVPCGFNLIGAEFAVQNVVVGSTLGCQPPATPVALATSETLVIRVR